MRRLMAELTARHTGQPVERILKDHERDRWFTPEEARDYGMIDAVVDAARPPHTVGAASRV
jgi:ATP-dependent Clp protease protease subunit